jgi:CubicO group peptidase (beta-lactamase class C family)
MKRIIHAAMAAILVLSISGLALAQTATPESVGLSAERLRRINSVIERRIESRDVSGAVTLVARRGRIAHLEAQGLMDIESNKPMAKDGVFRIASMTKPVVGVAILMMIEEGKVRLADPVSRFIPEFKDLKVAVAQPGPAQTPAQAPAGGRGAPPRFYVVPAEREITVRDLLTHTSGLVSGTISTAEASKLGRKPTDTLADYIPRLGTVPLEFQPGSRWTYSPGAGFDTLGRIVEIASGMPLDQFLRQRLFEPLGMKDTSFSPSEAQAPRVVTMYQKTANGLQKSQNQGRPSNVVYFSGGGGLSSTAEDYFKFAQMLVNGGQLNGKRLLGARTVELMGSTYIPDTLPGRPRGEGWGLSVRVVTDAAARNTLLSNGSFGWSGAFGTHFWVDAKEKLLAILMVQTSNQEMTRDFETAVLQSIVE